MKRLLFSFLNISLLREIYHTPRGVDHLLEGANITSHTVRNITVKYAKAYFTTLPGVQEVFLNP